MSKFIFISSPKTYNANINGVLTPIKSFQKGDVITGTPFYNADGTLNSVSYFVTGLPSYIPNIFKHIRISGSYVKPYLKDISNNKSMEYSNANGDEKNNNNLLKYSIIGLVSIGAIYGISKLIK